MHQRNRFEPTWLNFSVHAAINELKQNTEYIRDLAGFKITSLPVDPGSVTDESNNRCATTGLLYNPSNVEQRNLPPPGYGTQDQYAVGDLSGKLQNRNKGYPHNYLLPLSPGNELNGIYWDVFLPLQGHSSVVHRGITIERFKRETGKEDVREDHTCATLGLYQPNKRYQTPMFTAQVLFRYPIVGRILFRQPKDDPLADTTIITEYLIHADGSTMNTSEAHRWAIHHEPPGKDFYNWTGRCLSAAHVYNPFKVTFNMDAPGERCSTEFDGMCRLGDLGLRLGALTIAGAKKFRAMTRNIHTDPYLPLSGDHSILGKSLVIYDDFGPKARGERLACSM